MSTAVTSNMGLPDWRALTSQSAVPFRYTKNHTHHTWAKTHYTRPELYLQPESVKEIQHIVNTARQCRKKIITVGSGHSPSDLTIPKVSKDTWIVNLDRFSRVIGYSDDTTDVAGEEELLITVQAGIRLHQLAAALAKKGWNMPNLGSVWDQSIAGAIATSTHGSSLAHGLLSERVKKLTIMLSDGKSYECSKEYNQELFEAALVSLGGLGIVTYVTFSAVPQYRISWQQEIWDLPRVLEAWEKDLWTKSEFARVWWFPYSEKMIVWRADKVEVKEVYDEVTGGVKREWEQECTKPPYSWYGTWMGYHAYQMMLYVARWFPKLTPYVERFVFKTQYGWKEGVIGEAVEAGEKALLLNCLFSQYVNEWAIPLENGPEAISRLQSWLMGAPYEVHGIPVDNHGIYVHAPIEVRVTDSSYKRVAHAPAGRRALLDTSNPEGPSLYLNATLYRPYLNRGNVEMRRRYYRAFEWLMRQYNGRPHWAKNFLIGNGGEVELGHVDEEVKKMLGGGEAWDEMYGGNIRRWRAIREKADPEGVFTSAWLERTVLANEGKAVEGAMDGNGEASTVLVEESEGLEFIPFSEVE